LHTSLKSKNIKKPSWLKVKFPTDPNYFNVSSLLKKKNLHTICESARCPNIGECWSQKTATFLILGDTCTRNCAFCSVKKGIPLPLDPDEPYRVAEAASLMGLRYVVITSVTRDDLSDGGASHFYETINAIRKKILRARVEVLIPDFKGKKECLMTVINTKPEVLNHNLEVPETLYSMINRPKENYRRSLKILKKAKEMGSVTKSGLMIGLGERKEDILQTFSDLRNIHCDLLTIGQYLQPTRHHARVRKYYSPVEFEQLRLIALDFGFEKVESGPLVRSSFRANMMYDSYIQNKT